MTTLLAITDELGRLDELLTESGGEVTEPIQAIMDDLAGRLSEKLDSIGWLVRTFEARTLVFENAAAEMTAKATTERNKKARIMDYVKSCMTLRGETKVAGSIYSFSIQKNGGRPPIALLVDDVDQWPTLYVKTVKSIDRDTVRSALDNGTLPEGLAVREPVGTHLRLR